MSSRYFPCRVLDTSRCKQLLAASSAGSSGAKRHPSPPLPRQLRRLLLRRPWRLQSHLPTRPLRRAGPSRNESRKSVLPRRKPSGLSRLRLSKLASKRKRRCVSSSWQRARGLLPRSRRPRLMHPPPGRLRFPRDCRAWVAPFVAAPPLLGGLSKSPMHPPGKLPSPLLPRRQPLRRQLLQLLLLEASSGGSSVVPSPLLLLPSPLPRRRLRRRPQGRRWLRLPSPRLQRRRLLLPRRLRLRLLLPRPRLLPGMGRSL